MPPISRVAAQMVCFALALGARIRLLCFLIFADVHSFWRFVAAPASPEELVEVPAYLECVGDVRVIDFLDRRDTWPWIRDISRFLVRLVALWRCPRGNSCCDPVPSAN